MLVSLGFVVVEAAGTIGTFGRTVPELLETEEAELPIAFVART
jgi:hypothetical protein